MQLNKFLPQRAQKFYFPAPSLVPDRGAPKGRRWGETQTQRHRVRGEFLLLLSQVCQMSSPDPYGPQWPCEQTQSESKGRLTGMNFEVIFLWKGDLDAEFKDYWRGNVRSAQSGD